MTYKPSRQAVMKDTKRKKKMHPIHPPQKNIVEKKFPKRGGGQEKEP